LSVTDEEIMARYAERDRHSIRTTALRTRTSACMARSWPD